MDISVFMKRRMLRIHQLTHTEFLGYSTSVLQHGTHCRISVNIGILTLDIRIVAVRKRNFLNGFHQSCLHAADSCTFCTIQDICFTGSRMTGFNQYLNNCILHIFHGWCCALVCIIQKIYDFLRQYFRCFIICFASFLLCYSACCQENSSCDFFWREMYFTSVPFLNASDHRILLNLEQ